MDKSGHTTGGRIYYQRTDRVVIALLFVISRWIVGATAEPIINVLDIIVWSN